MPRIKVNFPSESGAALAGLLEMPAQAPHTFALFAHCFTCSKDIAAASRITQRMAARGVATLRFDFTGLGNSDGDFSNTNFSSNIEDLVAAAAYLAENYEAPALLIGHSLGGAAILAASHQIKSARALVTIGAPASAQHVEHLFAGSREEISNTGQAQVDLGGRQFNIKRQFLEDIDKFSSTAHLAKLKKALLVLHAPLDAIVPVNEAARIYTAAKHPKSYISLDQADHLLSRREDSEYVAELISAWSAPYLESGIKDATEPALPVPKVSPGQVVVSERDGEFTQQVFTENHRLLADEPKGIGGQDLGPNPYEFLLTSLGTCTSMTIRMYANRKNLPLDHITVSLVHSRIHVDDCNECESENGFADKIEKTIRLDGNLSAEQRERLLGIADRCPVHKTLHNEIIIETRLTV